MTKEIVEDEKDHSRRQDTTEKIPNADVFEYSGAEAGAGVGVGIATGPSPISVKESKQNQAAADQKQILNENSQLHVGKSESQMDYDQEQNHTSQQRRSPDAPSAALADVDSPNAEGHNILGGAADIQEIVPEEHSDSQFFADSSP